MQRILSNHQRIASILADEHKIGSKSRIAERAIT